MPITPTYIPLATYTATGSVATVTFSSIPATYRDLIIVFEGTAGGVYGIEFNADSSSIYSRVFATGNGSTTSSSTSTNPFARMIGLGATRAPIISQVMDYSATDKHKTVLSRTNRSDAEVGMFAHRYASTNAITSVKFITESSTFDSGSKFSLYGIAG